MLPDVSNEDVFDQATVSELLHREKGGQSLLRRLFEIYLEETPQLLEEVEVSIRARNTEDLYDALHQMKGSAAALGARRLFRTTEATLHLCRDGKILEVDNLYERLKAESDEYIEALSTFLEEN